jgi:hypothetical protein
MVIFQCRTASLGKECSNYHHGCLSMGIFIKVLQILQQRTCTVLEAVYSINKRILQRLSSERGYVKHVFYFHYTFQSLIVIEGYL